MQGLEGHEEAVGGESRAEVKAPWNPASLQAEQSQQTSQLREPPHPPRTPRVRASSFGLGWGRSFFGVLCLNIIVTVIFLMLPLLTTGE